MSVETNLSRHFGVVFENKLELSVCSLPSPITSQIQILTRLPYFSPPLHPPKVTCLSVNQTSQTVNQTVYRYPRLFHRVTILVTGLLLDCHATISSPVLRRQGRGSSFAHTYSKCQIYRDSRHKIHQ